MENKLPECPSYVAHPQAVWFNEHWRPVIEQLKAELTNYKLGFATQTEENERLDLLTEKYFDENAALKSKLKIAVEYIQNETRCEKTALPSRNGVDLIHTDDCRKCAFLKEIGEG